MPNIKTKLHFEEEKQSSEKLGELQKENSKLRERYDQCLIQLKDFRSKIKQLEENNEKLVKENEENSVLKSS